MSTKKVITSDNLDVNTLEVNTTNKLAVKVGSTLKATGTGLDLADNVKTKVDKVDTLEASLATKAETTTVTALQEKVTQLESTSGSKAAIDELKGKFVAELTDLAGTPIGKLYVE